MDKQYWNNYYQRHLAPEEPSLFARHMTETYLTPPKRLIELGCGNGRDARYFGQCGLHVIAIDQAVAESAVHAGEYVSFAEADFTNLTPADSEYDAVYSRFTLHSVSAVEQARTIAWSERALKIGGYLCIEARGLHNSLYGVGDPVVGERDAYIHDDHYRRFIDVDALGDEIRALQFDIAQLDESRGYAPFGDEDDYFIRLVAQKRAA